MIAVAAGAMVVACSSSGGNARGGSGGAQASGGSTTGSGGARTGGASGSGGTAGQSQGGRAGGGAGGSALGGGGASSEGGAGGAGKGGASGGAGGQSAGGASGGAGGQSTGGTSGGPRQTLNLNQAWKFMLGDYTGAEASSYNDSAWSPAGLPHSFSLPYFLWTQYYTGYGWYRRHLDVPAAWSGKRVFIEFQGAFQVAQIYVNGKQVGEHQGGYTGFNFDITSNITTGDNVIAVRLNNNWNARIAPRAGDHEFTGGIYRNVFLAVTDPLHLAWYPTFVTTPTLEANAGSSSTVNVKTEVRNDRAASAECTVKTDVVDASGAVVATTSSTKTIAAATTVTFDQTTPAVSKPALWSPDHPTLYKVVTTVSDGAATVDTWTTPFGFRWFSWSATNGFSLNGAHLYLHGVDAHQGHAGWADAAADSALYRDVKMVKDAGFNFIRGSHYPKAPSFVDACDQLGVLLWSENCFWGSGGSSGEGAFQTAGAYPTNAADQGPFETSVLNTLTDMIRIHRNHPSIVAWGMSNEPFFTADSTISAMRNLLTKEVTLSHQLDATRPAGIGGAQRPIGANRIDKLGDIAGYNGDGSTIADFQNPGVANIVNEYGSNVASTRPGKYDPGWGELDAQLTNGFPTEYAWRSGQNRWGMFDYGTHNANYTNSGIVDYFRIPKRAWYWYRNAYAKVAPPTWPASGTPAALQLSSSTTTLSAVDGTQDALVTVTVVDAAGKPISNNVPVTLTVTSGPGEFPTGPSITFTPPGSVPQSDIAILDGTAAIEFRTYYSGTTVITATSQGLKDATITIVSQGSPAFVPGQTPPAPTRTYSRYSGGSVPPTTNLQLALNHPTSASSTGSGTSAQGADGDLTSAWAPAASDTSPWWQVSLETRRTVNTLQVDFPSAGVYRYTIATSPDGTTWTTAVDQSKNSTSLQSQRATGSFGSVQFVKVSFTGMPAGLAEITVGGY